MHYILFWNQSKLIGWPCTLYVDRIRIIYLLEVRYVYCVPRYIPCINTKSFVFFGLLLRNQFTLQIRVTGTNDSCFSRSKSIWRNFGLWLMRGVYKNKIPDANIKIRALSISHNSSNIRIITIAGSVRIISFQCLECECGTLCSWVFWCCWIEIFPARPDP